MTEDILKNISNRLNSTIRQTNELFREIGGTDIRTLGYGINEFGSGTRLKNIECIDGPDKKWTLPYTIPVTKLSQNGVNKDGCNIVLISNSGQGYDSTESYDFPKNENDDFGPYDKKIERKLEGWTEKQRRVFLQFVLESENKMRMESLRLQDEYNKQLASKLAIIKNELYESNRNNLMELQQIRLERERWSLEEVEIKNSLSNVSTSLDSLQKAYDNLRSELEDRDFYINGLNGELSTYERLVDALRSDNSCLQNELHDKSEHVNRLQNDLSDAYLRLEAESTKFDVAESELEAVKLARKELMEQNKNLKVQLDSLALKNKFMVAEKETLENRNNKLEQDIIELNKETITLQTRVRNFEVSESSKVSALEERVESLTSQLKTAQVELIAADKRAEVGSLQGQLQTLKTQLKQANADNDALFKENAILNKKLEQEKALVREHLNNLYGAKCQAHALRSEIKALKESLSWASKHLNGGSKFPGDDSCFSDSNKIDLVGFRETDNPKNDPNGPKRRDIFAPTMFDRPDPETQRKIDELEKELTDLHLEKDRLESEMTRCNLGPGSPTVQRRHHFVLEGKVSETLKRITEVSGEIKTLCNT